MVTVWGQHFLKTCEAGVGPTAPGRKFLRIREAQGQGGVGGRWQAGPQHCSPPARTPPAGPGQGAECCHQQDQQAWPHSPPGLIRLTPQGQGHWGVVGERPRSLEREGSEVFGPLGPGQSQPVLLVSLCEPGLSPVRILMDHHSLFHPLPHRNLSAGNSCFQAKSFRWK